MATSALDLLIALDDRLDDLETTTMLPGSIPRVRQEWGALARASLQLLQARPRHPNDSARRLEALLNSLAATPGEYPLPAPGTGLMDITATIGCTTEIMSVRTVASPAAREQAGEAIRTSLEAGLARAARWTQRGFLNADAEPEPEIVRLAGSDADPHRSPTLQTWRIIGPTDPGIDGAVSRWESAATETITSPRLVTQLALQLAAADIALVCASASAVMRNGADVGALSDSSAVCEALDSAGRAWRETTCWPAELRLGGRASELRLASADLRQYLDDTLRTRDDWKRPDDMFAEVTADQLVAVMHSGLQSAIRVGQHVADELDDLSHGASRVWLDASQMSTPGPIQQVLDSARYEWLPDPAGFHSAEGLHHDSAEAVVRLVHATPQIIAALAIPLDPPRHVDDKGPWETVPVVLDPLRTAQERALLAAIAPADSQANTIGF
jgi:hypothetical protein